MNIFMYSSEIEGIGKKIQEVLEELLPGDQLGIFRSVDSLSHKLQEAWEEKPVVVILVCQKEELLDLVSIREKLYKVRLILVLPDADEGTISLAHRLRPNFLTYIHRNLNELKAVLEKMLDRN